MMTMEFVADNAQNLKDSGKLANSGYENNTQRMLLRSAFVEEAKINYENIFNLLITYDRCVIKINNLFKLGN